MELTGFMSRTLTLIVLVVLGSAADALDCEYAVELYENTMRECDAGVRHAGVKYQPCEYAEFLRANYDICAGGNKTGEVLGAGPRVRNGNLPDASAPTKRLESGTECIEALWEGGWLRFRNACSTGVEVDFRTESPGGHLGCESTKNNIYHPAPPTSKQARRKRSYRPSGETAR